MRPATHIAAQKLAMMCGMFLCFGVAMDVYNRLKLNIAIQPLWVNLVAYIGPLLLGMYLGYWLLSRVPMVCPACRGRVKFRREVTSWWRMPVYQYWCEACGRDVQADHHRPTKPTAEKARDTNW
jgi:hypothetical protein